MPLNIKLRFNAEKLSRDIIQKRWDDDLTARQAALLLNITQPAIYNAEEKAQPTILNYVQLCRWLGRPLEYYIEVEE